VNNRALAEARQQAMAPSEDDAGGTGGKLGADEVVFDLNKDKGSEQAMVGDRPGAGGADAEVRALWLRRLKTSPAEFLRNKFAYQLQMQKTERDDE